MCIFNRVQQKNGKSLFKSNENESLRFIQKKNTPSPSPLLSLRNYFRIIRQHDSRRIWELFLGKSTDESSGSLHLSNAFIQEPVRWDKAKEIILSNYLDFSQTLLHPICKDIYEISLQRLIAFYPGYICQLDSLDRLVDSLVVRYNAQQNLFFPNITNYKNKKILIGSIQVSGLTDDLAREEQNDDITIFHFFRHWQGTASGKYLLAWPESQPTQATKHSDNPNQYRRVGRTPVIARNGWKSFPIPRYDEYDNNFYEQSPRNTYRVLQEPSRPLLKIGHWRYGGHHDLLTPNMILAFDTELDNINITVGGAVARYLYKNFFQIFGICKEHLSEKGTRIWDAIEKDAYRNLISGKLGHEEETLFVYPSHAVTDHIVGCFYKLIGDSSVLTRIHEQIIPILPIRRHRTGSALQISGLTLEQIETKISNPPSIPSVVFFDDAIITERTIKELKRLFRNKSVKDISTLIILDRQRLPSADYLGYENIGCYWRLDVPPMGSEAHCPLCAGLHKAKDLKSSIASSWHLSRIKLWQEQWSPKNPATQWGDAGLKPLPVQLKNPFKKFGIKPDPDNPGKFIQIGGENECIQIKNSAGLVCWVTEMHSMTSRDDLPLSLLDEKLIPEVRIQLIASQLLMFAGEFDVDLVTDLKIHLIRALMEAKEANSHTSLAVLTLIAGGNQLLRKTIKKIISVDKQLSLNEKNHDFLLLLSFCLHHGLLRDAPMFEPASRLLKPTNHKKDILYRLHREIMDPKGKAHSSPLHRLQQAKELEPFQAWIPAVIASQVLPDIDYYCLKVAFRTGSRQLEMKTAPLTGVSGYNCTILAKRSVF